MGTKNDDAVAFAAVPVILDCVERGESSITYGKLAESLGEILGEQINPHFGLSEPLGTIQQFCSDYGAPCLASMVVTQADGMPGEGFAEPYYNNHPDLHDMELAEIVQMEYERIRNYDDWAGFLKSLGIEFESALEPQEGLSSSAAARYREYFVKKENVLSAEARRNPKARQKCLEHYGAVCQVCGYDSAEAIGVPGIIHVHHIDPVADKDGDWEIDPINDLIPLCPNCHAIVHCLMRNPSRYEDEEVMTIDRAKAIWESRTPW